MVIPAFSIVLILSSAPPLPPDIIAPACPILLPGGAVTPAINPTIGFLIL